MAFVDVWPFIRAIMETAEFSLILALVVYMMRRWDIPYKEIANSAAIFGGIAVMVIFISLRMFVSVELSHITISVNVPAIEVNIPELIGRVFTSGILTAIVLFFCTIVEESITDMHGYKYLGKPTVVLIKIIKWAIIGSAALAPLFCEFPAVAM